MTGRAHSRAGKGKLNEKTRALMLFISQQSSRVPGLDNEVFRKSVLVREKECIGAIVTVLDHNSPIVGMTLDQKMAHFSVLSIGKAKATSETAAICTAGTCIRLSFDTCLPWPFQPECHRIGCNCRHSSLVA